MSTAHRKANLQLIYAADLARSLAFYKKLFDAEPVFTSPRYAAFDAGGEALFAIWTGGTRPDATAPRYAEIGIMLATDDEVRQLYEQWRELPEIKIARALHTEVFGSTFLVQDPDGHIIRVCRRD
jgi:catechol 2,3-dioxygenase-like lactoylglutathione lyase family enzyme